MIGYDIPERREIFVKKEELIVCSFFEEPLKTYRKIGIDVKKITASDTYAEKDTILFIGKGLESQRLFYPSVHQPLREREGYLVSPDHEGKIRVADHE